MFADKMVEGLEDVWRGVRGWVKADHSQYFPIASPHSNNVLALYNGSLLSVIRVHGYMGQYFPQQFNDLKTQWAKFFRTATRDKAAKGFDLFWSYEYDPEGMREHTTEYRKRMLASAARRGLNIQDILQEEAEVYGAICANESQLIMVVTHIDSLPKADHKTALAMASKDRKGALKGKGAMPTQLGLKALEAVHEQQVNKVSLFLETAGLGYHSTRLNAYESLKAMRISMVPSTSQAWKPKLTLRDCKFRPTDAVNQASKRAQGKEKPNDWTFILPPSLSEQMVPDGMLDLGRYVVAGDRTYAPMYVSELAVDPQPLDELLRMCFRRRLPIRIVYSLMANSEQANYWNRLFASIFTFASASNRQITKATRAMEAYEEGNGTVFGYGVAITTWANTKVLYDSQGQALYDIKDVQKRAQDIETLVQQWGGQQIDTIFGCTIEGLMGATPGYSLPPACPKAPQIEMDVVAQLPLMRPARIWDADNAIWFRTEEGVLSPYQPFSGKQSAMLSLVMGGMGYGKSNLLSEHLFYFGNHPDADTMPYIRGIDFGASSSGVVSMIQDSLPANRRHEAIFQSFSSNGNMVKNLLDTRLGLKYPLEDHRKFLLSWLLILCDSLLEEAKVANTVSVLNAAILRVYEARDPRSHQFEPVHYRPESADPEVREFVERIGIKLDADSHYWEITEDLINYGLEHDDSDALHAAKIAQRRCVPLFGDLVKACDQLTDQFKNMPEISGKPLTAAIANALMNANSMFPCFAGITNTDVSESRVCVFDMSEAFGRGNSAFDAWQRSVYFAVVYRLLTEDLFVNKALSGEEMTKNQKRLDISDKLLRWHIRYLEEQDQVIKMFWGDELHRIGKVHGAYEILESMAYEGRKYRVGLMLGTQMPEHFPSDMVKLATSVFIFGASQSSEMAQTLPEVFELSDDERQTVTSITKPNPEKGAEVFVIHKVESGVQRLKLHFQLGSTKLWAFATEPEERALRDILYREGKSTQWARKVLSENVKNAKKAIKSMQLAHDDELSQKQAIRMIADELLRLQGDRAF